MARPDRLTTSTRDGLRLDVRDEGPLDGELVVLLHGFPQDGAIWAQVAQGLHAAGLRTLAPDQRGYSPAASPHQVSAYRGAELVADVLALLDAAGAERCHLVGHDWGAVVAWLTAMRAPERVASLTVLSSPHPDALREAMHDADQRRRSWYVAAFQVPWLPERVLARRAVMVGWLRSAGLPEPRAQRCARRLSTPQRLAGPIAWYRAAARDRSGGGHGDAQREGRRVQVPTTYVWGSRDVALGRTAALATADHVAADYRFVELDAGHWLPELEAPRVTEEILRRVRSVA